MAMTKVVVVLVVMAALSVESKPRRERVGKSDLKDLRKEIGKLEDGLLDRGCAVSSWDAKPKGNAPLADQMTALTARRDALQAELTACRASGSTTTAEPTSAESVSATSSESVSATSAESISATSAESASTTTDIV